MQKPSETHNQIEPQFYQQPPNGLIEVEDLENLIIKRLALLEFLEGKMLKNEFAKSSLSNNKTVEVEIENYDILSWKTNPENDINSHFILSIAFCKNEQLRNW